MDTHRAAQSIAHLFATEALLLREYLDAFFVAARPANVVAETVKEIEEVDPAGPRRDGITTEDPQVASTPRGFPDWM